MARVVEEAAPYFGEAMTWKKVITKELAGATRFMALSKELGKPAPVPSIFINGRLVFDSTPGQEELIDRIKQILGSTE